MPYFEKSGVYCFAHVGLSVGWSVCIGHDQQMNPIDFEVSGSKVEVSVTFT